MTDVPSSILAALGGQRFMVATGARGFSSTPYSLEFQLPSGPAVGSVNRVRVVQRPDDTYNLMFMRAARHHGAAIRVIHDDRNIPAQQLRAHFTRRTGLTTQVNL